MDGNGLEGYAGGNMTTGSVRESAVTGRRIATVSGTNVVRHVYDGMHVVADLDGQGNILRSYTWGPGIDNLLAMTVYGPGGTNTYQTISDHLGTVHALVDDSGDTVESYRYDAWGNVLGVFDGNGGSLPSSVLGLRYLFQGREYSWAIHAAWDGAGLYYLRARWYDPATGRWLSNDPIGISGGLNQYAFCANNPVMFVDPEGCKAGEWYHSPQCASIAALKDAQQNTKYGGVYNGHQYGYGFEWGGRIYQDKVTGLFSYTPPKTDGLAGKVHIRDLPVPVGTKPVLYYHSHPGYWYTANGNNYYVASANTLAEAFSGSDGDTGLADSTGQIITVVTPTDRMLFYNPFDTTKTQDGKPISCPKCGCNG